MLLFWTFYSSKILNKIMVSTKIHCILFFIIKQINGVHLTRNIVSVFKISCWILCVTFKFFFFWWIYRLFLSENCFYTIFSSVYEAAQLFSTLIIIRNVSRAANRHIRMISEGSCDTEDWSNDAENSALITEINYILKYIKTENRFFKL